MSSNVSNYLRGGLDCCCGSMADCFMTFLYEQKPVQTSPAQNPASAPASGGKLSEIVVADDQLRERQIHSGYVWVDTTDAGSP